jgi:two-component system, NtrC family, sensor kinase
MSALLLARRRILVVDDNLSIHDDFRRILTPVNSAVDLDAEADALLGAVTTAPDPTAPAAVGAEFDLAFAAQGEEGRDKVAAARLAGKPFALAFVDMRMPPGWDGLTTITKMWEIDHELHVVICTAHSDRSWDEIAATLTARDRWAVLKKPFDKVEVLQLAHVMTAKWQLTHNAAVPLQRSA